MQVVDGLKVAKGLRKSGQCTSVSIVRAELGDSREGGTDFDENRNYET